MIRSTVQHVRLTTMNLAAMIGWYARVFGMMSSQSSSTPGEAASRLIAAWSSNDVANPRITLLSVSGLAVESPQSHPQQPQNVRFECATLDDLLGAYLRLRRLGIDPVVAAYNGTSTTFYYEDPDQNVVELTVERSHQSGSQPLRMYVDPEKLLAGRAAGMSDAEVHQHAYSGEFAPPPG